MKKTEISVKNTLLKYVYSTKYIIRSFARSFAHLTLGANRRIILIMTACKQAKTAQCLGDFSIERLFIT